MRLPLILDLAADSFGDRLAIDGDGGRLTFAGLRGAAGGLAAVLATGPGSTLGYLGLNGPALPVALFGAAMAGRPFAPLNYRLTDPALRRLAARLAPATIVADPGMAGRLAGIEGVTVLSATALLSLPAAAPPPEPEGAEPAVLLFTSGTTGEPKAALLGHEHLTAYVLQTVDFASAGPDEAALVSVPPYHIAGIAAILSALWAGRRMVYLPEFHPETWVDTATRHGVTQAMLVPTMLDRILDVIATRGTPPAALRALACGGGRMPRPVIERALRLLPDVAFTNAYGLTETSSTIAVLGPEDHAAARSGDPLAQARLESVGRPVPGVEIAIRDAGGHDCPPGQPGEVRVRGAQVAGRYAGGSHLDAQGWFATRDRGWCDADGYLFLDGRLDDVIVRGGENISPGEVEDALRRHPAVADAAVVGAPDPHWGEQVVAFVVLRPGAEAAPEDLRAHVAALLRSTRAPAVIHLRPALPYTETGKLLRRVLRDDLAGG